MREITVPLAPTVDKKLTERRILHLCVSGVIVPAYVEGRGNSSVRWFNRQNLFDLAIALDLVEMGMASHMIKALLVHWRGWKDEYLSIQTRFGEIRFSSKLINNSIDLI